MTISTGVPTSNQCKPTPSASTTPYERNINEAAKKVGKGFWQRKQCLSYLYTFPKHNPGNPPGKPSPNYPLISLPNLQLPLHLHARGPRMVPVRSPSPHPPSHIPAPRPAHHLLATNTLHLCHPSNNPQWPPFLADLAIDIPSQDRDIRSPREADYNDGKCSGVLLYCHHLRSHAGHLCTYGCSRDGV